MSQSGLLNEDEIKSFLSDAYNIKIERDDLIRPTKETVKEIYSRLQGDILKPLDGSEASLLTELESRIKFLVQNHDQTPSFNMHDLIKPQRKRTNYYINVLIFCKSRFDEKRDLFAQKRELRRAQEESLDRIKQEVSDKRAQCENLAYQLAQLESIDNIQDEIRKKTAYFRSLQSKCDVWPDEVKVVKQSISNLLEAYEKNQQEHSNLKVSCDNLEKSYKFRVDAATLEGRMPEIVETIPKTVEELKKIEDEIRALKDQAPTINLDISLTGDFDRQLEEWKKTVDDARARVKSNKTEAESIRQEVEAINKKNMLENIQTQAKIAETRDSFESRKENFRKQVEARREKTEQVKKQRAVIASDKEAVETNIASLIERTNGQIEMLEKKSSI